MEMDTFLKQLNKAGSEVKMSQTEKLDIRNNLITEMKKGSVVSSPYSAPKSKTAKYAAFSAFVLFGGVAVSFAAQNSLPGDLLYPIKTKVNEKLARMMISTDIEKANFEISLANRRLEEAVALKVKGTFNDQVKTNLQNNFNQHTVIAQTEIINVSGSGQATASAILTQNLTNSLEQAKSIFGIVEATITEEVDVKTQPAVEKVVPSVIKKVNSIVKPIIPTGKTQTPSVDTNANVDLEGVVQVPVNVPIEVPNIVPTPNTAPVNTSVNNSSSVNTPVGSVETNTSVNNTVQQVTAPVNNVVQETVAPVSNTVSNTLKKLGL